jgi:hypothetical protein
VIQKKNLDPRQIFFSKIQKKTKNSKIKKNPQKSGPCESKLLMVNCYCIFGVYLVTGTKGRRRNIPDFFPDQILEQIFFQKNPKSKIYLFIIDF